MNNPPCVNQIHHGGKVYEAAKKLKCLPSEILDFSANLNHYTPEIKENDWLKFKDSIFQYPPEENELKELLAHLYQTDPNFIIPTVGAIQALHLACSFFKGKRMLWLEPGFSEYSRIANIEGLEPVPISVELSLSAEEKFQKLVKHSKEGDVILLCIPQNPSGEQLQWSALIPVVEEFSDRNISWILDESFIEMTQSNYQGSLEFLDQFPNLFSCRSLTKNWKIPGLRFGFLSTSNAKMLERSEKNRKQWSISGVTNSWAQTFLNKNLLQKNQTAIARLLLETQSLIKTLEQNFYWKIYPTDTSFFLCELPNPLDALDLSQQLLQKKILLRTYPGDPSLKDRSHLRIGSRTKEQNLLLIEALRETI